MGNYWSSYSNSRTTVVLEPTVKKADTEVPYVPVSSESAELKNLAKVMDTTSPITSDHVEIYVKGEKKEVKKEEEKKEPKEEPKEEPKKYTRVQIVEQNSEENVILLSSDELKQRILGMAELAAEVKREKVKKNHKKTCAELLQKVKCYEHVKEESTVDSDDEDVKPLSREELKKRVLRELENTSKKANVKITEKAVQDYVKEFSKERIRSPSLEPVKEETLPETLPAALPAALPVAHPYLVEYGTAPIKTNVLVIDNRSYYKSESSFAPIAPITQVTQVTQVTEVSHATQPNHHKKQKKRKQH